MLLLNLAPISVLFTRQSQSSHCMVLSVKLCNDQSAILKYLEFRARRDGFLARISPPAADALASIFQRV